MTISLELMGRLPASAQERLRVLYQQSNEAGALSSDTNQRLLDIRKRETQLETFRSTTASDRDRSPQSNKSKFDDALREFDAELESLAADRARFNARLELSKGSRLQFGSLLRSIEGWLDALPPDIVLAEHSGGDKSYKTEVSPNAIEKQRRRIRELLADLRRTDAAPYPAAVAKQAAREQIEQLAERGRPAVYRTIELLEQIEWPEQVIDIPTTLATPKARDGIALVAWLQRDALIAAVEKEIHDNATDEDNALTDAQRSEAFKVTLGDLLAAEREEEALIQAAHFRSDRRIDSDPRAVLGLSSELPGPKRELVHRRLILSIETFTKSPRARPEGPGKSAAAINMRSTTPTRGAA